MWNDEECTEEFIKNCEFNNLEDALHYAVEIGHYVCYSTFDE